MELKLKLDRGIFTVGSELQRWLQNYGAKYSDHGNSRDDHVIISDSFVPIVVLSSIIIAAMLGFIDYDAAIHLWHVDKFDFLVCVTAYIGVVFANIDIGLVLAVSIINHLLLHNSFYSRLILILIHACRLDYLL